MSDKDKQERFLQLLKTNMEKLERYTLALCRNRQDAKDLAADTILIAYENFEKLRDEKAFLSYIFTIASRIYSSGRKKLRPMVELEDAGQLYCNRISPETATDIQLLYEALWKLSEERREAIILSEIFGLKHKEIAEIQNTGISSVKMRILRGKRELRKILGIDKKQDIIKSGAAALI